jgi:hypothetical protein
MFFIGAFFAAAKNQAFRGFGRAAGAAASRPSNPLRPTGCRRAIMGLSFLHSPAEAVFLYFAYPAHGVQNL